MQEVKAEIEDLFSFLKDFEDQTGRSLVLTLFVDDLDRCMDGRCVNVLEAIQLILSIPGSPVVVFLAVDARVVVSSIESVFNKSLNPENFEVLRVCITALLACGCTDSFVIRSKFLCYHKVGMLLRSHIKPNFPLFSINLSIYLSTIYVFISVCVMCSTRFS